MLWKGRILQPQSKHVPVSLGSDLRSSASTTSLYLLLACGGNLLQYRYKINISKKSVRSNCVSQWKLVVFSISSNSAEWTTLSTHRLPCIYKVIFKQSIFWFLKLLKQRFICYKRDVSWLKTPFLSDVKLKFGSDSGKAWLPLWLFLP